MRDWFSRWSGQITAIDAAGIGVAIVMTFALGFGLLLPLNARCKQQAAVRQTAARERQHYAGLVTAGRTLGRQIQAYRQQIATAPLHLCSENSLNQRMADIAQLSAQCDLRVEDLKPDDSIQETHHLILPIRMSGHGSYQCCTKFIHSLHQQLPDVDVRSFKLSGTPNNPAAQGSFEIQLGWFALSRGTVPEVPRTLLTATVQ